MINRLNSMDRTMLRERLIQCCGSTSWAQKLTDLRPYADLNDLVEKSNQVWYSMALGDWKEAFSTHPRIGDLDSLRQKFSQHSRWSKGEQDSVQEAKEYTIGQLKILNDEYYHKFGYIFIVYATGKSAEEMLDILSNRISNSSEVELATAVREQNKITRHRLQKLLDLGKQ